MAQRELMQAFDESNASIDYIAQFQRSGSFNGVDEERLILGLNSVGWVPPLATNMITVRELQSTGNISLILDVSVRMAIGQFERSYADAESSASQNLAYYGR